MWLFSINTHDYTDYTDPKTYSVNREDSFTEWTDANLLTHRDVYRTRISGSFKLGFSSENDYTAFLADLTAAKTSGGYCAVSLFINNENTLDTVYAFLSTSAKITRDEVNGRIWIEVSVKVTER